MSRANDSAFPSHGSMGEVVQIGLTIREHFAAMALNSVAHELHEGSDTIESIARELGIEPRDYDHRMHWDKFVARRTARRADAIIAELAKVKP